MYAHAFQLGKEWTDPGGYEALLTSFDLGHNSTHSLWSNEQKENFGKLEINPHLVKLLLIQNLRIALFFENLRDCN